MPKIITIIVCILSFVFNIFVTMLSKIRILSKTFGSFSSNRYYETNAKSSLLSKKEAKNILLNAKQQTNITFDELANRLNKNKVWLTSAIYGEHPIDEELAEKLLPLVGLKVNQQLIDALKRIPEVRAEDYKKYANDPFVSRLNELVRIYGPSLRALTSEMCGNGIVSAIDCKVECDKYCDEDSGDVRVVIKIDGKFLKYKN